MPLVMQGADDLEDDLTNMAANIVFGSSVKRALEAGAVPIEQQMLANASHDPKIITGDLHGSIRTGKVKKRRDGGHAITIGVHYKEKGAFYANSVETGHGGPAPAPAHPFVRPAFDTRVEEAYSIMKGILRDELTK